MIIEQIYYYSINFSILKIFYIYQFNFGIFRVCVEIGVSLPFAKINADAIDIKITLALQLGKQLTSANQPK